MKIIKLNPKLNLGSQESAKKVQKSKFYPGIARLN